MSPLASIRDSSVRLTVNDSSRSPITYKSRLLQIESIRADSPNDGGETGTRERETVRRTRIGRVCPREKRFSHDTRTPFFFSARKQNAEFLGLSSCKLSRIVRPLVPVEPPLAFDIRGIRSRLFLFSARFLRYFAIQVFPSFPLPPPLSYCSAPLFEPSDSECDERCISRIIRPVSSLGFFSPHGFRGNSSWERCLPPPGFPPLLPPAPHSSCVPLSVCCDPSRSQARLPSRLSQRRLVSSIPYSWDL